MHKVFAYQTLKQSSIRKAAMRLDKVPPIIGDAKIDGYIEEIFTTKEGKHFHTITPKKDKSVKGKVFEVTRAELEKLDEWEDEYDRHLLKAANGETLWVYILKDEFKVKKEK